MRRVRHRAARLPSDSGRLVVREHTIELRLSRPFPSPLATITGDIASAQSYVAPFPPRVLVIAVPPSMTRHDPEPMASPRHLSARSAHAFAAGTPLSPATHNLDLTHPPWAAPVGRHGCGSTLPHSPATVPAREHPRTCTRTHGHVRTLPYRRCPGNMAFCLASDLNVHSSWHTDPHGWAPACHRWTHLSAGDVMLTSRGSHLSVTV